jgi:quercetin dioxygenase-like cupin family protein
MEKRYTFFEDISNAVETIPTESIVSRTVYRGDGFKTIVFAFDTGQELSEHTASVPAIIQILKGEADLTLGEDHFSVGPGAWARMEANLPHSLYAKTPVIMLLLMLEK